jgi:hypothetical protein
MRLLSGEMTVSIRVFVHQRDTTALPAGSFFVMTPGMQHFVFF